MPWGQHKARNALAQQTFLAIAIQRLNTLYRCRTGALNSRALLNKLA
jgi:hypothetical protein